MGKDNLVAMSFGKGENHVAPYSAIPNGYARTISNFDIDDQGLLQSRAEFVDTAFPPAHSAFVTSTGAAFAVSDGRLCIATPPALWATVPSVGGMTSSIDNRMWWCEHDGSIYYSDGGVTGRIKSDGFAYSWGVANSALPDAGALAWVTTVDDSGEESGAILSSAEGGPGVRVYMPTKDPEAAGSGDAEFITARGTAKYRRDGDPNGRICDTFGLVQFPAAVMIGFWSGRAWGVSGQRVVYSQPLRYGLHDPAYDYFAIPADITAFGAVADGMFICTADAVYFVKGFDPMKWKLETRSDVGAYYGSQVYVPTEYLHTESLKVAADSTMAFCWLSKNGLCYGFDGGDVRVTGAETVRIPAGNYRSSLVVRQGMAQVVCVKE